MSHFLLTGFREAKTVAKEGLRLHPDFVFLHDILASIALAQGDLASMESEESLCKAQPDLEASVFFRHGDIAASHGQLRQAGDFYEKARQVGQRVQVKSSQAFAVGARGWVQALAGYRKEAIASANASLEISQDYNQKLFAGDVLAFAGESKKALDLAGEVAKARHEDVLVQAVFVPSVRAVAALSSGDAAKAIELLKPANAYDNANTQVLYVRGLALLKAGHGNEAAQEFQKILTLRSYAPSDPLMSFARLGLGRAYALQGDSQKSRAAYQDFFALWKDADPDIPILLAAKSEYAKLK